MNNNIATQSLELKWQKYNMGWRVYINSILQLKVHLYKPLNQYRCQINYKNQIGLYFDTAIEAQIACEAKACELLIKASNIIGIETGGSDGN